MGLSVIILAAILFPVFAQARSKARTAMCMSNQKQMTLAAMMYAQDNDEHYPVSTEWMTKTQPYINNTMVNHCPAIAGAGADNTIVFGYAFNSKMSERSLAQVNNPPLTALLYDSSTLTENASDPVTSLPEPPRHNLLNVISFADGHAKSLTIDSLQALLNDPAQKSLFSK